MNITPAPVPNLYWTCADCGTRNSITASACSQCSKARGAYQKVDGSDRLVQDVLKDAIRAHLERQSARTGDPNDMFPIPTPEMTCTKCGTRNKITQAVCSNCGTPLIPVQATTGVPNDMFPVPTPEWTCSKCGTRNKVTHAFCANCGNALVPGQSRGNDPNDMNPVPIPEWTCSKCGTRNRVTQAVCSNCNNPLMPVQGQAGAAGDADAVRAALRDQIASARADALKGLKKPPG
ncbi:MAG: zinc ribbon domain-containing protein [Acidobacteria bacterium]|nr:zinc ribbon domain-containing protein [Acidobacteriota bacterium]